MATALCARLGFRPALAAPGRLRSFAVRQPLLKPFQRRLAAAQPAAPPAPPPNQQQGELQDAQQPASGAKPVSANGLDIALILAMAVCGFIGPVSPLFWVSLGLFICFKLLSLLFR